MKPTTKTVLIAVGATVAAIVVLELVNSANSNSASGGGPPSVSDSIKYGAAVTTAAGSAWFINYLWGLALL